MRRALLLAVIGTSLAFAPAPLPRRQGREPNDPRDIQGTWVLTGLTREGKAEGGDGNLRWVFAAATMQIHSGGNRYYWNYTIDPNSRPRALDMSYSPNGRDTSVLKSAYSLDGDVLKIGYDPGAWDKRPASDKEAPYLMTFRRER